MLKFKQNDAPPKGAWKSFRKKSIVQMLKMNEEFECYSREGIMLGQKGDFLALDGHGGYYPISAEFHEKNYERIE